jgi:hypothetical protein
MVLARLRKDLDDAREEGVPPTVDAILVTGDIAFSGGGRDPKEYADAKTWLLEIAAQFGLDARSVFVVPGNHDVNRGVDRDSITALVMNAIRGGNPELDTALGDAQQRTILASRMRGYLDFAAGFAPVCLDAAQKDRLFWVHRLTSRGLAVRLAGLNTALLSAGDDDLGKLRLGKQQLHEALGEPPAKGELVMVLTHHPLGWLADADSRYARDWIRNNAHVFLSGHVHEQATESVRGGGSVGGLVNVVAGAAHGERQASHEVPAGHGYSWGAVVHDGGGSLKLRIFPRLWSDRNTDFRLDVSNVPRNEKYAEHLLPVKLAAPPPPPEVRADPPAPPVTPAATKPAELSKPAAPAKTAEVFIFHAPEDGEQVKKLETHLTLLRRRGMIKEFSARSLNAGAAEKDVIDAHIETAEIFLAIASPSFVASDQFDGAAWKRALERVARNEAVMITAYLRPFDREDELWKNNGASRYKAFPDRYDNLGEWIAQGDPDTMFTELTKRVRKAIEDRRKG